MNRPSLAVVLVVLGNPGVRGDVRMAGFSADASLDEVCDVLSAGSDLRKRTLRVNALHALGRYIKKNFRNARQVAEWMARLNIRLGVWAAASCAREVLHLVPQVEQRPRTVVDVAEAWVKGEATRAQAKKAADEAEPDNSYGDSYAAAVTSFYVGRAASADSSAGTAASYAGYAVSYSAAYAANASNELRRLVGVISERMVLFPEWTGDPSDDRWPLPTKRNR